MRYKKLGRTGLLVSELCFGTMTFGGGSRGGIWANMGALEQKAANDLMKGSFDAGVNFFDTANVYASGESETIVGQAIRDLGLPRDEIVIATKAFGRFQFWPGASEADAKRRATARNISGLSRKHLMDAIDASLLRLGLDHVDLYQIHGSDPLTPLEETLDALDVIVRAGKVRYIGFCNLAAWQAAKVNGIAERKNLARFESAQVYYSIGGRDIEREIVPLALEENMAILPWSPLAGGFFSGKFARQGGGPNDARRAAFDFPPVNRERGFDIIDVIRAIADEKGVSVATIALAWMLHKPGVTSIIIGAKTVEQLKQNIASTEVRLSAQEMAKLDEVSALPVEYPGWMLDRQGGDRRSQVN